MSNTYTETWCVDRRNAAVCCFPCRNGGKDVRESCSRKAFVFQKQHCNGTWQPKTNNCAVGGKTQLGRPTVLIVTGTRKSMI